MLRIARLPQEGIKRAPTDEDLGVVERGKNERERLSVRGNARLVWPTASGRPGANLTLEGETKVAVAGDWESLGEHVYGKLRLLRRLHPEVHTVLHLGDLRWEQPVRLAGGGRVYAHEGFLPRLEELLAELELRLLLTPGNHDDWSALGPAFAAHPERPRRLSPHIWAFPRGFRFSLAGRTFLSFGGAVSVDADRSLAEAPTDADVDRAARAGSVDVLLTHEPPNAGVREVEYIVAKPGRWSERRLTLSAASRRRIDRLVAAVQPALALHGHMHVGGRADDGNGRQTIALPVATEPDNLRLLDLPSLTVTDLGCSPATGVGL
ncbi:metallophosphoesterase [Curtobacterium sp. MCBD17_035]|uniref:metallophosphoesterase n=1 Tax=Curtobacterium sp. MCBD17_035 TaxID=2175673 RepID=UPI000DA92816|nr:metallophosphoesterase [Curtobacterium sp. MCBD17_035]WIB68089.1 metallophosphoesterase [Curtobacterium sp. MCBD17_035]